MPFFRGIGLSIVSTADHSIFPEFPHPDGSSAGFHSSRTDRDPTCFLFHSPRSRTEANDRTAEDAQKVSPKISVYIPSAPGSSFFIHYSISRPPAGYKYLFFKVCINGHHIVAWGVNLYKVTSGATCQALYQPSELYEYNDGGVVVAEPGIESRSFRFVPNAPDTATSIAEDGGLIEIQVFRARARSRRAPQLEKCMDRAKYGIALVSNGLLDDPHLAYYYNYHLADARDSPYSSFLFHYRSWDNLRLLQIAPFERPDSPLPVSCAIAESEVSLKEPLQIAQPAGDHDGSAPHSPARSLPPLPSADECSNGTGLSDAVLYDKTSLESLLAEDDVFWSSLHDSPDHLYDEKHRYTGIMMFPFTDSLCKRKTSTSSSADGSYDSIFPSGGSPTPRGVYRASSGSAHKCGTSLLDKDDQLQHAGSPDIF